VTAGISDQQLLLKKINGKDPGRGGVRGTGKRARKKTVNQWGPILKVWGGSHAPKEGEDGGKGESASD